jgi:3-hydroxyacyl-[acyl-carrier-protein] dehydratase
MAERESCTLRVPADHPVFAGHFPGRPIVPGVMLLEWVLAEIASRVAPTPARLRVREVKFFAPLEPERVASLQFEAGVARATFAIHCDGAPIARGVVEWDGD